MSITRNLILEEYKKREAINDHTGAAALLVHNYGSIEEQTEIASIQTRHKKAGFISDADYARRTELSRKYFPILRGLPTGSGASNLSIS